MIDTFTKRTTVFLILGLALFLRIAGVQFGLPHLYHADEPVIVHHALAYGTGDFNPHFFNIPPLISYLLFGVYGLLFAAGKLFGIFSSARDFEFLFYRDPTLFFLSARLVFGVLLGTLSVYWLYRFVRRHFSETSALLAASIFAVCFLHVRDSHYVYADIPLIAVMILAFDHFFSQADDPQPLKKHLWAGIWIGVAAAVKYNGVLLVLPYLLVSFRKEFLGRCFRQWLAAGLAAGVVFFLLNPYAVLDFHFFVRELHEESQAHNGIPWLHTLRHSLPGAFGWPLLLTAFLGIFLSLRRPDRKRMAVLIFLVAYYAVISRYGQIYARYALPLTPFISFFAAEALARFWSSQKIKTQSAKNLRLGVLLILLAIPFTKSVLFTRVMTAEDVRTVAEKWVEAHIPAGSRIALDDKFYMPRLNFEETQLQEKHLAAKTAEYLSAAKTRRLDYLLRTAGDEAGSRYQLFFLKTPGSAGEFIFERPAISFSVEDLRTNRIQYVILGYFHEPGIQTDFREKLAAAAEKIKSFTPYRREAFHRPYSHPVTGGPFLFRDLWERERNGQPLEIYRLKE